MWYKNKFLWAVVVILAAGAFWYYHQSGPSSYSAPAGATNGPAVVDLNPKPGEIAVTGTLNCLPLKSGAQPTADQCIIGLRGDDSKIYALNTTKVEELDKGIGLNTKVRIVGPYTPADVTSEEAKIFKYDGVIGARVIQNKS